MTFGDPILTACMDAFSQEATIQRGAGPLIPIRGVFDRHATIITGQDDTGAPITARKPIMGIHAAELPVGFMVAQGDTLRLTLLGTWRIDDVQPDGLGGITLILGGRPLSEGPGPLAGGVPLT